jgi:hypothetical protein
MIRTEDENLLHILTRCSTYTEERKKYYCPIKETVIGGSVQMLGRLISIT